MISKLNRFHGLGALNQVYSKGQTKRSNSTAIKWISPNRRPKTRVAVVVSKKVHKSAVTRNRIRRRIFEIVRFQLEQIHTPSDIIITVFDDSIADIPHDKLESEIKDLLNKSQLIKSKQ